jgi:hypothetical protein
VPLGREDLRDETDILRALADLRREHPEVKRALVKLDRSHWDEGDALFTFPTADSPAASKDALRQMRFALPDETPEGFLARFARTRGVVEELLEDVEHVASGQARINPRGLVSLTSTHDEIRGGPNGLVSEGCRFPADDRWRASVQEQALRVAEVLAGKGMVSRISVEFMVRAGGELLASEINLGVGGSTHPLLAVRFLSEGALDPETGLFTTPAGRTKYYRATDYLRSPAYRGLVPEDVVEIATMNGLSYSPQNESGALFYMLGALSEHGRVGMVAIGNSRKEAEAVFSRTVATLDRETAAAR